MQIERLWEAIKEELKLRGAAYGLSALATFTVLGVQYLLRSSIGGQTFLILYPAVFFCCMVGGAGPGWLSTLIGAAGAWSILGTDALGLVVFLLTGLSFSIYSHKLSCFRQQEKKIREELERAKLLAEDANGAKSRFLANMSHEIRTPLGVITGFAELALESGPVSEDIRQYIQGIKRNGDLLSRIVGEILDLSKVEANKLEIEISRFSLSTFIDEVMNQMEFYAKEKGTSLHVHLPDSLPHLVETDNLRLRQILINLINNAIKFTPAGRIDVYVSANQTSAFEKATIEFTIVDTGIGMSWEAQQKIFQPFSQADSSTTRKFGGTGLGLTLSRELARALGGDLVLRKSSPEHGSSFHCFIRASIPETEIIQSQARPTSNPTPNPMTSSAHLSF